MVIFTLVLGIAYPLVVTGIGQAGLSDHANGSIVSRNGTDVGSSLIAQSFLNAKGDPIQKYVQPRPSAANYDPSYSTGSNLGPTNPKLIAAVRQRADAYRELNGLSSHVKIPVDAVTASASGLDPDISVANARLQAKRVADERGISVARVRKLIDDHINGRTLGILGEKTVNVFDLNLALDRLR